MATPVAHDDNLLEALWRHADMSPDRPLLAYRDGDRFVEVSAREVAEQVHRIAAGLIALGVQPQDRVALMSKTRIEWTYVDYAIQAVGGVTVPIYETSSAEQVEWILSDSGSIAVVCENEVHAGLFREAADRLPACRHVFVIDSGGIDEIIAQGASVRPGSVDERAAAVTGDDLATLIYTSGTTGLPKGCMLTHRNLCFDVAQTSAALDSAFAEGDSTLLFLPLAHSFAKIVALVLMERGVLIGYSTGVERIPEELKLLRPTFLVAVPRIFEKVYNVARRKAAAEGKGRIFDTAARVAGEYSRQRHSTERVLLSTKVGHAVFDRLVYGKLREAFGGRLRYAVSGGAPLGERLGHFYDGIGIKVLEGYGLTETSPVLTVNTPERVGIGTVGHPIPGTELRIAPDGEVLCRGAQVFTGYWRNETATRQVFDPDGWFHTGDLGELDSAGRLRITGRKKDLIVTAGGKNVAPAALENRLRAHPLISDSVVVGDQRPYIAALVALDAEGLADWAADHGKQGRTPLELMDDRDLAAEIDTAVDEANRAVSRAEQIRRYVLLPRDLTIAGGELTPTLKVRRAQVTDEYRDLFDQLYPAPSVSA
jgi:long-chain acyl-CoA synthetase